MALCAIALATRPEGAPLTVILRGERMPGTEDGPRPDFAGAFIDAALRRVPPTCGSGPADLAAAARPSGLPPERARHGRRPGVGQWPTASPLVVLVVVPVSVTHSRSMTSRLLLCVRATARTVACRRRALETVEKVVTDLRLGGVRNPV